MRKRRVVVRDPDRLNREFYESYDEAFLFRKAHTLLFIADHLDEFAEFITRCNGDTAPIDERFAQGLCAEVYFTEFHQFEAFFALLLAVFQDEPHWVYLTDYPPGHIKKMAEAFLERDVRSATNGRMKRLDHFLNQSIYTGFASPDAEVAKNWQKNLDNITWMLDRLATKYCDGLEEYNSYKHGLRVFASPSYIRFTPTGSQQGGFGFTSKNSVRFLVKEPPQEGMLTFKLVSEPFSPEESLHHLLFMADVLETVKSTRLAAIRREKEPQLNSYVALNKDDLRELAAKAPKWSLSL
ncbi:MAG: hypothetical protein JSW37_09885 [Anaerolineales bacterium]|nr:MAG: hypothetical protein JSW37_09885 [Anaerolineales bacterium]